MGIRNIVNGVYNGLEMIAMGATMAGRSSWNAYTANDCRNLLFSSVNTLALYAGLTYLPDAANANINLREFLDVAAPIVAGTYALSETRKIASAGVKGATQVMIATAAGFLTAGQINDYHGSWGAVYDAEHFLHRIRIGASNFTGKYVSVEMMGGAIGFASGAVGKALEAYGKR